MSLPGFTAQDALYASQGRYRSASTVGQACHSFDKVVSPTQVRPAACDPRCRTACKNTCTPGCLSDFTGNPRGACLRECERDCSLGCGCRPRF